MVFDRFTAGLLLVAACTGESSTRPSDSVRPPAATGSETTDASETSAEASDRRVSLLSWSFEPASADCNSWPTFGGESIRAAPPRSGAYSCKICSDGSGTDIGVFRDVGAVPAGHYELSAWVRKRSSTSSAPKTAFVRTFAVTSSGTTSAEDLPLEITDDWKPLVTSIDLPIGASELRVVVAGVSVDTADRCMFVDDVSLVRG